MDTKRREFLKRGLMAIGTAATGAAASKNFSATGSRESRAYYVDSHSATGLVTLTTSGRLILAPTDATSHHRPGPRAERPTVRTGVLGGRHIMTIDLTNCDGRKICLDLSGTPYSFVTVELIKVKKGERT